MRFVSFASFGAAMAGVSMLASCSMVRGFGQDMQKAGKRLENRAEATGGTVPEPSTPTVTAPSVTVTPPTVTR